MKKVIIIAITLILEISFAGKFSSEDYKYALWMATRFYGAQRCGKGPNWLIMDHGSGSCHLEDADGDYDLSGGWHDCGDYVKFGQTQFYSAYALLKAYDAFPTGFYDNYSYDYSGYSSANNFHYGNGKPNGIPDVLDEVRYAIEYFIKVVRDSETFYYQVGDGDSDHKNWVTSTYQSTLGVSDGGNPRPFVKAVNGEGKAMAAQCAAALALFSNKYKQFDVGLSDISLEKAKIAFEYAENATSTVGAGFYPANPSATDDMVAAALELYKATGKERYLTAAKVDLQPSYWVLCYDHIEDFCFYDQQKTGAQEVLGKFKSWIDEGVVAKVNNSGICDVGTQWGELRYTAGATFGVALYANLEDTDRYDSFIKKQVDHILGDNDDNMSFLTGFNRQGVVSIKHPHHRNVFLNDSNVFNKDSLKIPSRNEEFGYMIGGTQTSGYVDSVDSYTGSEGGIDYNAGLVGALAYIVSKLSPADTFATTIKKTKAINSQCTLRVTNRKIVMSEGNISGLDNISIFSMSGRHLFTKQIPESNGSASIELKELASGTYIYTLANKSRKIILKGIFVLQ